MHAFGQPDPVNPQDSAVLARNISSTHLTYLAFAGLFDEAFAL